MTAGHWEQRLFEDTAAPQEKGAEVAVFVARCATVFFFFFQFAPPSVSPQAQALARH